MDVCAAHDVLSQRSMVALPVSESTKMIRLLIADDQRIFRSMISRTLAAIPGIEIVGEAGDGDEALRMAVELQPDIILMDVVMPTMNGIEATRRILDCCPQTRIIGLSVYDTTGMEELMRAAGAIAYVPKARHWDALLPTIYSVQDPPDELLPNPT